MFGQFTKRSPEDEDASLEGGIDRILLIWSAMLNPFEWSLKMTKMPIDRSKGSVANCKKRLDAIKTGAESTQELKASGMETDPRKIDHDKESVEDFMKRFNAIHASLPEEMDDEQLKAHGAVDMTNDHRGLGIIIMGLVKKRL